MATAARAGRRTLRISVLGWVSLTGPDGRPVQLMGEKCRLLLAVLACRADRSTPVDMLVDVLWGERPPRSSLANIQTYVSRIRRALADADSAGADRLDYQSGSYRLYADEETCDVQEMLALHGQAVAIGRRTERPADALPLFDRAFALWRGRPFSADAAEQSATVAGEQRRCEELYLRVCEDRTDAAIDDGAAADMVPLLRRLVGEYPLRERLHAQLIRCLHQRGEYASALLAYRDAASVLGRELGVEPGPELRGLYLTLRRTANG